MSSTPEKPNIPRLLKALSDVQKQQAIPASIAGMTANLMPGFGEGIGANVVRTMSTNVAAERQRLIELQKRFAARDGEYGIESLRNAQTLRDLEKKLGDLTPFQRQSLEQIKKVSKQVEVIGKLLLTRI